MNPLHHAIIDTATEVAVFSKTHSWPAENSPEFFQFAELLDKLGTQINAACPGFNANVQRSVLAAAKRQK